MGEALRDLMARLFQAADDLQAGTITAREANRIASEARIQRNAVEASGVPAGGVDAGRGDDDLYRALKDLEARLRAPSTDTRRKSRLTDKAVERLKPPPSGRLQVPDSVITGLWLRVGGSGAKSWSVLYRVPGRKAAQRLTLGRFPGVGCSEARMLGKEALAAVARGEDPAARKRERRHVNSDAFELVAEEWLQRCIRGRFRTAADVESQVRSKLISTWSGRSVGSIGRPEVLRVLDREMDRGHERAANKLLGTVRRLFLWAVERGYCQSDPTAGLKPPGREAVRERVLSDDELKKIWTASEALGWPWSPFVRLLILTAQRRSEVAAMSWGEVDLNRAVWTIPGDRSKNGRAHEVPLSAPAVEIVAGLPRFAHASDLLFPTSRAKPLSGYTKPKQRLDQLSGVTGWRLHDLRRTVASGMARLGTAPHVVGEVLGHTAPGVTRQVYNRYTYAREKTAALAAWAAFVSSLAGGAGAEVVRIGH